MTQCNVIHFCNCVLRLLGYYAERKNPLARKYYDLLCEVLQKTNKDNVREFILENLMIVFRRYQKMPLGVFLNAIGNFLMDQPNDYKIILELSRLPTISVEEAHQLA
jgi:hypothetical protein